MRTLSSKRIFGGLTLMLVTALLSVVLLAGNRPAAAQTATGEGIVCTSKTGTNPTFTLTTEDGYIGTPDDNVVYMWGYAAGGSSFQHPSPVLCVNEGDNVTIILHNTLPEDVSITFPGQENVLADGAPAQPQFDGGGNLSSLTNVAPANGGSVTYSFTANQPGTFIYQSGTDPAKQVRMGLFGALIVRPALGPNYANNRPDSEFNPDTEFMVLLSEIDPYLNMAVERQVVNGQPYTFNMANYHPRYWLINGRGFPDSFAPNFASWLPTQPYGALARVEPFQDDIALPDYNPGWSLTRYISVGTVDLPMHPHSKSALVVGRDGRAYEGPGGEDLSFESFSLPMGPGQTWDGLFRWYDPSGYDPDTNPVTVDIPNSLDTGWGPLYSGVPYLGQQADFPVDFTTMNQCGEYYVISHVHALHKITSWGAPMTGPITFLRIDPPGGCP
jgi:FtsP/CotA-like multicopper oxidase with cupredoxin domain